MRAPLIRGFRMSGIRESRGSGALHHRRECLSPILFRGMTRGLERWYGGHDLHFITCSCYRRRPSWEHGARRDLFLRVLERARQKYRFVVIGYVVMPEHFHFYNRAGGGKSFRGDESGEGAIHQAASPRRHAHGPIWQKRFYDFNVCSTEKRIEKLRYMHRNPVKRGLVTTRRVEME